MKTKRENAKLSGPEEGRQEKDPLPGYPEYPESEDIYSKYEEEEDIDPESISDKKESPEKEIDESSLKKDLGEGLPGRDLDIPGSELDDKMEDIGSEDEENNYYSMP